MNFDPALLGQVRGFVEANMTSRGRLLRGVRGQFDPVTGLVGGLASGRVVYEGPCRIRDVNGQRIVLGEASIDTAGTTISIPRSASAPRRDDLFVLLDSEDIDLVSRTFHVDEVTVSGFWDDAHRMTCTTWLSSSRWGADE